ncbi:MAG TPA: histidine--tRNA ligase [Acidimicrobiia bacterium]|nr:histidine--tRNA ligase [Acidimicrobiia bacterium]HIL46714.1 histidine--tRNA ligase [Acidimicrobiia bacterium]
MASPTFRAPKGTRDIMWPDAARWRALGQVFAQTVEEAGYTQVIPPMFENIEVFKRLGDATDVVSKEMYDFEDKGGRHMALRPEQTASIVRAFVEHRPLTPWKAWYSGPNFRYERAQKGRYRQFDQVGIEALGPEDPHLDVEVIALAWRFYQRLGLRQITLMLNSLGSGDDRERFIEALQAHFATHQNELSEASRTTLAVNPLRVLDSKREQDQSIINSAPKMLDFLSPEAVEHFEKVQQGLNALGIPYTLNPRLVRGLDYYVRTTFEFISDAFDAAQNAVGGGGRYDGLAESLGGPATPGVGFALGVDRTLLACDAEETFPGPTNVVDIFVVDTTGGQAALALTAALHQEGHRADRSWDNRSMKAQMKAADRSGAQIALIIGEEEAASDTVTVRDLRGQSGQTTVPRTQVNETLRKMMR